MKRDLVLHERLHFQQQFFVFSSLVKLPQIFYSYHVTSKLGESTLVAHSPLHVTQAWRDKDNLSGTVQVLIRTSADICKILSDPYTMEP